MQRTIAIVIGLALMCCLPASLARAAPSAGDGSARAFVERVVRSLNVTSNGPSDWVHLSAHGGYDPSFSALMAENGRLAQGVDLVDADPLCACQDTGGHYSLTALSQTGPNDASAHIAGGGEPVTAILKRTAGAWHVYDVVDAQGSFRAQLIAHNACMRKFKQDAAIARCFAGH
jgi:hypothetical protein